MTHESSPETKTNTSFDPEAIRASEAVSSKSQEVMDDFIIAAHKTTEALDIFAEARGFSELDGFVEAQETLDGLTEVDVSTIEAAQRAKAEALYTASKPDANDQSEKVIKNIPHDYPKFTQVEVTSEDGETRGGWFYLGAIENKVGKDNTPFYHAAIVRFDREETDAEGNLLPPRIVTVKPNNLISVKDSISQKLENIDIEQDVETDPNNWHAEGSELAPLGPKPTEISDEERYKTNAELAEKQKMRVKEAMDRVNQHAKPGEAPHSSNEAPLAPPPPEAADAIKLDEEISTEEPSSGRLNSLKAKAMERLYPSRYPSAEENTPPPPEAADAIKLDEELGDEESTIDEIAPETPEEKNMRIIEELTEAKGEAKTTEELKSDKDPVAEDKSEKTPEEDVDEDPENGSIESIPRKILFEMHKTFQDTIEAYDGTPQSGEEQESIFVASLHKHLEDGDINKLQFDNLVEHIVPTHKVNRELRIKHRAENNKDSDANNVVSTPEDSKTVEEDPDANLWSKLKAKVRKKRVANLKNNVEMLDLEDKFSRYTYQIEELEKKQAADYKIYLQNSTRLYQSPGRRNKDLKITSKNGKKLSELKHARGRLEAAIATKKDKINQLEKK